MKTMPFILGFAVALTGPAWAETNSLSPATAATDIAPADVLVTKPGTVYNHFRVIKSDPAGLIIRYVPDEGGIGMEKVPFELLPESWQRSYNYDSKKAAQFDLEQKQATAYWRDKMVVDEQAYREKWARLAAAEEAAEKAKRDAEAAAALGTNAPAILDTNLPAVLDTNAPAISTNNVPTIQVTNTPPPIAVTNVPTPPPRPQPTRLNNL
jgi:hypothetical protein